MDPITINDSFKKNYIHHINCIDKEFQNIGIGANNNTFVKCVEEYKSNLSSDYILNILEIGTKQSILNRSTHHKNLFTHIKNINYVMTDIEAGNDVDVVCDVHKLSSKFNNFDVIIT
tara:strand:- start:52 stop:402 length:351 start_codon:yes stop_codon:yes gene_type:complete